MTIENEGIKEINLSELSNLNQFDLSGGFICDVETGICGPTEEMIEENVEEKENENNDMV